MTVQNVDLYQPMMNSRVGPAPVVLRVGVTPNVDNVGGGVPQGVTKAETYVLLSCLPTELQERVKLAVQMLISGM